MKNLTEALARKLAGKYSRKTGLNCVIIKHKNGYTFSPFNDGDEHTAYLVAKSLNAKIIDRTWVLK